MKKLFLSTSLVSLLFCVACGYGSGNNPFPPTTGNFNNASLSGHYAYQLTGIEDFNRTFREAGVFTADGNGNITGGTDDLAQGADIFSGSSSGSYSISNDGTGTIVINVSNGRGLELAVTLVNSSKLYLVVGRTANATLANGAGVAEKQDSNAFVAPPSGTFVFRMHTLSALQGPSGSVGRFNVSGGVVTGNLDVNRGGASSSLTLTSGLFNSPDSNGRGTGSFTDSSNHTSTFAYYVVDANNLRFFSTDAGILGLGRTERQASATFANASLSGGYAFGSSGETGSLNGVVKTVGRFTAGGDGTINDGAFDSAEEGTPFADIFIGTYNFDPSGNGRADVTLNPTTGSVQEVFWMVSPSRAFFLINDAGKVEDGTIDLQQSASFSNSTLEGQFAFVMDGTDPIDFVDRVGTVQADGAGGVILSYFLDRTGVILVPPRVTVSGTYSVSSTINGRVTSSVDSLSNNLVFYLVSGNDAYILQNDSDTEIDGSMGKQP